MFHIVRTEHRHTAAFIAAILFAFVIDITSQVSVLFKHIPIPASILYCFIIIAWAVTAVQRIIHKRIRQYIAAAAVFLLLLFIVRICRWIFFLHSAAADRYLWYLYYISYIAMPMLSLTAAFFVGRDEADELSAVMKSQWTAAVLMMTGVLTNDLHHFALTFSHSQDGSYRVSYHWLYFVIFAWSFIMIISSYILLIKRCQLSQCRKNWYVPIIPSAAAFVLIILYYAAGGSPTVFGIKLYNIQEVYLLLFMGLWEGCISIGLISSNTGYSRLFEQAHINAEMKSTDGKTVYRSSDWSDTEGDPDYSRKTYTIRGGSVTWSEDISVLNRLNSDIEDLTEQIEDENVLIEEENRLIAEKAKYETQNRLYDRIAMHTHPQLVKIDEILHGSETLEHKMERCLLLGTYVKRCSNLMLIAGRSRTIPTSELYLSIRESMEHMRPFGIESELMNGGLRELASESVIAAYDVFEAVTESIIDSSGALSVNVSPSENILLSVETDTPADIGNIETAGLKLTAFTEDEIQHIVLSAGGEANG